MKTFNVVKKLILIVLVIYCNSFAFGGSGQPTCEEPGSGSDCKPFVPEEAEDNDQTGKTDTVDTEQDDETTNPGTEGGEFPQEEEEEETNSGKPCCTCPDPVESCGSKITWGSGILEERIPLFQAQGAGQNALECALSFRSPAENQADLCDIGKNWRVDPCEYLIKRTNGELLYVDNRNKKLVFVLMSLVSTGDGWLYTWKPYNSEYPKITWKSGIVKDANGNDVPYDDGYKLTKKTGWVHYFTTMETKPAGLWCGLPLSIYVARVLKVVDPNGHEKVFNYNEDKQISSISDPYGRVVNFEYGDDDNISTITTNDTPSVSLAYENDMLTKVTLFDGNTEHLDGTQENIKMEYTFEYDENNNLIAMTNPNGNRTQYAFNNDGQVISSTDANGNTMGTEKISETRYNITNKRGKLKQVSHYDNVPAIWTKIVDPLGRIEYQYADENMNIVKRTDPCACGEGMEFAYDENSNVVMTGDNLGNKEYFTFNSNNRKTSAQDKNGNITSYVWDDNERLTEVDYPLGVKTDYEFDDYGNITEKRDALGNCDSYSYTQGCITQKNDKSGNVWTYTIDYLGRNKTETDPDGNITGFEYDCRSSLCKKVGPTGDRDGDGDTDLNDLTLAEQAGDYEAWLKDFDGKVLEYRDHNGNITKYEYDATEELVKTIYADSTYEQLWRDEEGNITKRRDRRGKFTFYVYDDAGQMVKEYDDTGSTTGEIDGSDAFIQYTYNERGQIIFKRDKLANITEYLYDDGGRLIKEIDACEGFYTVEYDANGNVTKRVDKEGKQTLYTYDARNRLITSTDHNGNVTTNTYDAADRLVSVTDARSVVTYYTYDGEGRVLTETEDYGAGRSNIVTAYTYDGRGNRTSVTRDYGNLNQTTTYAYDAHSRLIQQTDPTGVVTAYTYDLNGNRLSVTQKSVNNTLQLTTTYTYDNMKRVATVTDPAGTVTAYTYDDNGNRLTQTNDVNGFAIVTKWEYDSLNRVTSVTSDFGGANAATTTYAYDANGNLLNQHDAMSRATTYEYDAMNRRVRTIDALGNSTQVVYNKVSNVVEVVDANTRSRFTVYDNLHRVTQTLNEMSQPVNYTYDAVGNRLTLSDANSNTTGWAYDALNRPTGMQYANGNTEGYGYDRLGRLVTKTTPNGVSLSYAYDAAGRLLSLTTAEGTVTNTYDGLGRIISTTSPGGNMSYTYDTAGRLYTVTDGNLSKTVQYTYNSLGLRTALAETGGNTIQYGYDRQLRLTGIQKNSDPATAYSYDASGLRTGLTLPNGVATAYTYDNAGRLTGVTSGYNGTVYAQFAYTLDPTGNRTAMGVNLGGVVNNIQYQFDTAYRLAAESRYDSGGSLVYSEVFQYDAVGNRVVQNKNGVITTRTYNNANQLANELSGGVTKTYGYDNNGNNTGWTDTGGNAVTMTYDSLNRMTSWTDGTNTETNAYRGAEWHRTSTTAGGVTTAYLYDGDNVLADYSAGAVSKFYVTPFLDQNVSMTDASGTYYYTQDGLGSVRTLTNAAGAMVNKYDYTAFGETYAANTVEGVSQRYTYTGREKSGVGAPMYYRWRHYNAGVGRFISRDPIGYDRGSDSGLLAATKNRLICNMISTANHMNRSGAINNGNSIIITISQLENMPLDNWRTNENLYAAMLNNPVMYSDPTGEYVVPLIIVAGASIAINRAMPAVQALRAEKAAYIDSRAPSASENAKISSAIKYTSQEMQDAYNNGQIKINMAGENLRKITGTVMNVPWLDKKQISIDPNLVDEISNILVLAALLQGEFYHTSSGGNKTECEAQEAWDEWLDENMPPYISDELLLRGLHHAGQ